MNRRSHRCPDVSVVMCVFRPDPRFFRQAVRSVLAQTMDNFELIIVEDPSEVSGRNILADVADPRIRHYANERRTSLVEQRNRGLFEARAELVALLDCDDVAEPERLQRQLGVFATRWKLDVLGSQVSIIDARDALIGHRRFPLEHEAIVRALHSVVPLCHPSVMFRKQSVLSAGAYQNSFGPLVDDYDLYSRLVARGGHFANCPDALTRYRLHPQQTKAKQLRETIRAVLRVKRRYWRHSMHRRDKLRMLAEHCLLWVPQAAVLHLLKWIHYRDESPPARRGPPDNGSGAIAKPTAVYDSVSALAHARDTARA